MYTQPHQGSLISAMKLGNDIFLWVPFSVVEKSASTDSELSGGKLGYIRGIATSGSTDQAGEIIDQETIDWSKALDTGLITLEHPIGCMNTIGFLSKVEKTQLEDGTPAHSIEAALYLDVPMGRHVYDTAKAMQAAGDQRRFGFSVEGKVPASGVHGNVLRGVRVTGVVVTATPCNEDSYWLPVAASLMASMRSVWRTGMGYPVQGAGYDSTTLSGAEAAPLAHQSIKTDAHKLSDKDTRIALVLKEFPMLTWAEGEQVAEKLSVALQAKQQRG